MPKHRQKSPLERKHQKLPNRDNNHSLSKSPQGKTNRKQSADYALLQQWIKTSGKIKDPNFAVNSFSTRVTFSSKGEKQFNEVIEEPKDKKKIIVSVETRDSFGNRQRLSGDLKTILRDSGIRISKISQEGSIEMDFDNLFESESAKSELRSSLKESGLKKELEQLFKSEYIEINELPDQ